MQVGDLVKHKLSGIGVIINIDVYGHPYPAQVDFEVVFTSGKLFWVDSRMLEVVSASR